MSLFHCKGSSAPQPFKLHKFAIFAQTQMNWSEMYLKLPELVEKQRHTNIRSLPTFCNSQPNQNPPTIRLRKKKYKAALPLLQNGFHGPDFQKSEST
jgi:hypothetical protein